MRPATRQPSDKVTAPASAVAQSSARSSSLISHPPESRIRPSLAVRPKRQFKDRRACVAKSSAKMRKTAEHEMLFVNLYCQIWNATRAVIECGAYNPKNATMAARMGTQLLKRPRVQAAIAQIQQARRKKFEMEAEDVIRELVIIARGNMYDYARFQPDGSAHADFSRVANAASEEEARALASPIRKLKSEAYDDVVGKDENGDPVLRPVKKYEVELYSKQEALALLGKHFGLFQDPVKPPPAIPQLQVTFISVDGREVAMGKFGPDPVADPRQVGRGDDPKRLGVKKVVEAVVEPEFVTGTSPSGA